MNLGLLLENDNREECVLDCGNSQEPLFLLPCLVINIRRPVKASVAWEGQGSQKLTLSWMKSGSLSHESNVDQLKELAKCLGNLMAWLWVGGGAERCRCDKCQLLPQDLLP